jgi:hypothetical protein
MQLEMQLQLKSEQFARHRDMTGQVLFFSMLIYERPADFKRPVLQIRDLLQNITVRLG